MISVGSSFVTVGGSFVEYSGPIVPPEPPVDHYFQLTNRGSSEATLYVTSGSNGQVFINDEFMGKFSANIQKAFTVPAGAIVKITGLSRRGNGWDYGTLNSNSSSNNFSIDRFDNSISNPDYMFCRFNGLKSITSWAGAENYTVLHDTFAMSTGLATLPASWNGLGNVTQMIGAFNSCGLTSIPSSYAGLGKLTRSSHAFAVGAEGTVAKMTTGGDSGLETLSELTWSEGMFYGQSLWTGNAKAIYDYLSTKSITVTNYGNTFINCIASTGYDEIPGSWGGGGGGGGTVEIGGRIYKTVTIGGVTWLAENLDYKFSGLVVGQGSSSSEARANYYNNDEATYGVHGNKYGLLYNWTAVKYLEDNKSQLIPGWHVPTTTEWDALTTAVGGSSVAGTKLKSTTGWVSGNGDGSYNFEAFPAGGWFLGSFGSLGSYASFWTATEYSSSYAYYRYFSTGASMGSASDNKSVGYSVRLVKD